MQRSAAKQKHNQEAAGLWDSLSVKAFLNAKIWKFEKAPWTEWLTAHGGTKAVMAFIQSCQIPPPQDRVLKIILENPGESREFYASAFGAHESTWSAHVTE